MRSWSLLQRHRAIQRTPTPETNDTWEGPSSLPAGVPSSRLVQVDLVRNVFAAGQFSIELFNVLDGEGFRRSFLVACIGELGDKTFMLTVALAVWCPWTGVREADDGNKGRFLLVLSTFLALVIRIFLVSSLADAFPRIEYFKCSSCVLMIFLAWRAYVDMCSVEDRVGGEKVFGRGLQMEADATRYDLPNVGWNRAAFAVPPPVLPSLITSGTASATNTPTQTPRQYQPNAADGVLAERISDRSVSLIISFVLPLIFVFMLEAEDKSEAAILFRVGHAGSADATKGVVLGLLSAVMLAVVVGAILERRLADRWGVFLVLSILCALTLVEFGQTLLYLPSARVMGSEVHPEDAVLNGALR